MIAVTCPRCPASYSLPDSRAGEKTFCLECGSSIQMPELPEQTRHPTTPSDHHQLVVGYSLIGIAGLLLVVVLLAAVWPEAAPEDPWRKANEAERERRKNEEREQLQIIDEAIRRSEEREKEQRIREMERAIEAIRQFDKKR